MKYPTKLGHAPEKARLKSLNGDAEGVRTLDLQRVAPSIRYDLIIAVLKRNLTQAGVLTN